MWVHVHVAAHLVIQLHASLGVRCLAGLVELVLLTQRHLQAGVPAAPHTNFLATHLHARKVCYAYVLSSSRSVAIKRRCVHLCTCAP